MNVTRGIFILLLISVVSGCVSSQPKNMDDICEIFREKSSWYRHVKKSEKKHGMPIGVQMAIMHQESSFKANAKPPRRMLLGFIPWFRPSSAFGFAQVKDETWDWYREKRPRYFADRDDFSDAADFIGWYGTVSQRQLGVSKWDAYNQYLAYHEGHGGFKRKTYLKKPWLVQVARKVKVRSQRYSQQLKGCEKEFARPWWWPAF